MVRSIIHAKFDRNPKVGPKLSCEEIFIDMDVLVTFYFEKIFNENVTMIYVIIERPGHTRAVSCFKNKSPDSKVHGAYIGSTWGRQVPGGPHVGPMILAIWEGILRRNATWWHHQMETFSMLLALCAGNSLVTGEFPAQRPVMWSFDVSFDLCLNEQLLKQSWGWWFETPSRSLWRHCNEMWYFHCFWHVISFNSLIPGSFCIHCWCWIKHK